MDLLSRKGCVVLMLSPFIAKCFLDFFVAFGVVLGGSMMAGISAVLTLEPSGPVTRMELVSEQIKIWAMVAAIGGTIDPIRAIESQLIEGHLSPVIKQIIWIACAFIGAHTGSTLIQWICRGGAQG